MAIKVKIPRGKRSRFHLSNPLMRAAVAAFIIVCTVLLGVYAYFYIHYQKLIDQRMAGPVFANTSKIYATPRTLSVGYKTTPQEIATHLRKAGYTEANERAEVRMGTYKLVAHGVEIKPGPESFHDSEGARIEVNDGAVSKIVSYDRGTSIGAYELEPQLVTGLFQGEQRSKRRLVTYDEIPTNLVHAVLAIEDRKFFEHGGINYLRFGQAVFRNLVSGRKGEGGSTLTMQIARGFFLTPEKTITRKAAEMMIATELEQRYTKKQIFEFYANHVNMGQRGSFSIDGLGEAAQAYFGKDIKTLNLQECALLAALIQRPNYLSPYKHPERAMARRNLVLEGMVDTGAISREQADLAKASPLKLAPFNVESSDAPYFVDLVKDQLLSQYSEEQLNEDGLRIYTTIDPDLQAAAAQAVDIGLKEIDELVKKNRTRKIKTGKGKNAKTETKVIEGPPAQVALVALNPQTGEVLALVGGRNYGWSQLNHAVAKRPTGSIFKPFVFAAAVNNALDKPGEPVFTAVTPVDNTPTTFFYEDKTYEPRNYGDKYNEVVTARFALAHSLNNATVRIAEAVGYQKVADLARQAGISSVRATPALALGSYDATPLDMAGAYTVFANAGVRVNPIMITSVRDAKGDVVQNFSTTKRPVLDPRVAYVVTNMMEGVVNNGTAAGVRARGFNAPAAGKTGTSHDAWFAGYTSNLLCVVWVGLDDYTDIKIEGAKSAAPIWAEFMKRAVQLEPYKEAKPFTPPDGVIKLNIDKVTNRVATASCPDDFDAAFIAGTEPTETCDQSPVGSFFSRVFGLNPQPKQADLVSNDAHQRQVQANGSGNPAAPEKPKEKKGFFGKIFGVFKGDDKDKKSQNQGTTQDQQKQDTPPRPQ